MVMGFNKSPQILQRDMNSIFEDIRDKGVMVYMDDIVVYGRNTEAHNRLVKNVFSRLKMHKMRVNPKKLQLGQETVKLLGVLANRMN
ncbi:hypothetical protein PAEPH01_2942 [Pancytospora epiphaga]|nr:hypothetical protein PAEPH01_2942 [Pancytospora epiphaga]